MGPWIQEVPGKHMVRGLALLGFPLQVKLLDVQGFGGACGADTGGRVPQSRAPSPALWTGALLRGLGGLSMGMLMSPGAVDSGFPSSMSWIKPQGGWEWTQEGQDELMETPNPPGPKEPLPRCLTEGCEGLLSPSLGPWAMSALLGRSRLCLPTAGTSSPGLKPLPRSACIIHRRAWAL